MTNPSLDHDDPKQPFQQVAAKIRAAIVSGELEAGAQLKSVRALADEHGVSPGTIQRAIRTLRDERLITSWQGRGAFVRTLGQTNESDLGDVQEQLADIRRRLEALERAQNTSD